MTNEIKVRPADSAPASAISAQTGLMWRSDELKLRQFDGGVSLGTIRAAVTDNNLDEIVFQASDGKKYVVYADELVGKVQVGDQIEVGGLRGTVILIDNEWNEDRVAAGAIAAVTVVGVMGGAWLGAAWLGSGTGMGLSITQGMGALIGAPVGGAAVAGSASLAAGLKGAFRENDTGIKTLSTEVRLKK